MSFNKAQFKLINLTFNHHTFQNVSIRRKEVEKKIAQIFQGFTKPETIFIV
jgi:hypothetical protein